MALREAYTTKELAAVLGYATTRSVFLRADREAWQSRKRAGRGGGKEWLVASMPEETRLTIRTAEEKHAAAVCSERHSALPLTLAKADLVRQYLAWQRKFGATRTQKDAFITAYKAGAWPRLLEEVGPVSWQTLERWKLEQERAGSVLALADKRGIAHRGRTALTERHQMVILGHVLNPNAPNVSQCVREVRKKFMAEGLYIPSEPTIRRFVTRYTSECFDEWTLFREGKKAWNDKCAISLLRDWSLVDVGDVVIADGHTLNFETLNPETGKPKRMTIVLFYDGACNHPLGSGLSKGKK